MYPFRITTDSAPGNGATLNTLSQKLDGQGSQLPSHQLLPQVLKLGVRKTLCKDVAKLFLSINLLERHLPLHDLLPEPHCLSAIILAPWSELGRDCLSQNHRTRIVLMDRNVHR